MRIDERSTETVTILELSAPLTGDFSEKLFLPQIDALLAEGKKALVLDLSSLPWVNSTGIGHLVATRRKVEDAGGRIALAGLNDRVRSIFDVVGLSSVWEVFEDVGSAIAAFESDESSP